MVQLSYPYMTTGKTMPLTTWPFVGKVMSLLFNMLSRLVIAFHPRSKCLLISLLQSPSAVILEPRKILYHCLHFYPIYGSDTMILAFWMLSFKPDFSPLLSPSSRGSLVPLHFLPLGWYHLGIWGCWYFSPQSWFQLMSHPAQYFAWCTLHIS